MKALVLLMQEEHSPAARDYSDCLQREAEP